MHHKRMYFSYIDIKYIFCSLGMNCILDLENVKVESQKSLFTEEEWAQLKDKFPAPGFKSHHLATDEQF